MAAIVSRRGPEESKNPEEDPNSRGIPKTPGRRVWDGVWWVTRVTRVTR